MTQRKFNLPSKGKCALFFDLDGTLLSHDGKIDEKVRREIMRIKALGHMIFVNTGRSKAHLPAGIATDPLFDGLICGSAYIEKEGKVLMNKTLCPEAKADILRFADKTGVPIIFEGVKRDYLYLFEKTPKNYCIGIDISKEDFLKEKEEVTKMTFCRVITDIDTSDITTLRVIKFRTYGEGIIHGCDKAKAMGVLLSELRVPKDRIISFGDSENDIEMLKASGVAVVMPHGAEKAKEAAHLTMPIDEALRLIFPEN